MNLNELDTIDAIQRHLFQSKSFITLHNEETDNHFTYKILQAQKPVRDVYWIYVLTMSNNADHKSYKFMGAVSKEKGYRYSKNAQVKITSQSNKTANWFFHQLFDGTLKTGFPLIKIYKSADCEACGKMLTTPESLKYGHGAVCLGRKIKDGTIIISDKDLPDHMKYNAPLLKKVAAEYDLPIMTAVQAKEKVPELFNQNTPNNYWLE